MNGMKKTFPRVRRPSSRVLVLRDPKRYGSVKVVHRELIARTTSFVNRPSLGDAGDHHDSDIVTQLKEVVDRLRNRLSAVYDQLTRITVYGWSRYFRLIFPVVDT